MGVSMEAGGRTLEATYMATLGSNLSSNLPPFILQAALEGRYFISILQTQTRS